jgi:hypothetical protein
MKIALMSVRHYFGLLDPMKGDDQVDLVCAGANVACVVASVANGHVGIVQVGGIAVAAGFLCYRFAANAISKDGGQKFQAAAHTLVSGGFVAATVGFTPHNALLTAVVQGAAAGYGIVAVSAWRRVIKGDAPSP